MKSTMSHVKLSVKTFRKLGSKKEIVSGTNITGDPSNEDSDKQKSVVKMYM